MNRAFNRSKEDPTLVLRKSKACSWLCICYMLTMLQAVQHIEAIVGKADASAQYERVMRAVKSFQTKPAVRRVMPALHSY